MKHLLVCVIPFILVLASGCGESHGKVTGTIQINGKPMEKGTITFLGEVGEPIIATIANGHYEAGPMVAGEYRVAVVMANEAPPPSQVGETGSDTMTTPGVVVVTKTLRISELYADPEKSGLKFEVQKGNGNRFDYDFPVSK